MSWQRRLREMLLAGGSLAVAACSKVQSQSDASTDAANVIPTGECCNVNPDPCCEVVNCGAAMTAACSCQMEGGTWNPGAAVDGGPICEPPNPSFQCCNANPDPCCEVVNCGAPMSAECACQMEGGTFQPGAEADGGAVCLAPDDAGSDAWADAGIDGEAGD